MSRARLLDLLVAARALPEMTPRQREEQALDFAYGNLAASTDHKPTRDGFRVVALKRGWSPEEFEAWANAREWWSR